MRVGWVGALAVTPAFTVWEAQQGLGTGPVSHIARRTALGKHSGCGCQDRPLGVTEL